MGFVFNILAAVFLLLLQTVNLKDSHSGRFICPLDSCDYITQEFNSEHHAMDFGGSIGDPVYAADRGLVYRAGENCSTDPCANAITMLHDDGELATNYWHLDEVFVKKGDRVARGDIIGTIGMTGITSGPHLHFSVQYHREFVNPEPFF